MGMATANTSPDMEKQTHEALEEEIHLTLRMVAMRKPDAGPADDV